MLVQHWIDLGCARSIQAVQAVGEISIPEGDHPSAVPTASGKLRVIGVGLFLERDFFSYTGRDPEGDAWADRLMGWFNQWDMATFAIKTTGMGLRQVMNGVSRCSKSWGMPGRWLACAASSTTAHLGALARWRSL